MPKKIPESISFGSEDSKNLFLAIKDRAEATLYETLKSSGLYKDFFIEGDTTSYLELKVWFEEGSFMGFLQYTAVTLSLVLLPINSNSPNKLNQLIDAHKTAKTQIIRGIEESTGGPVESIMDTWTSTEAWQRLVENFKYDLNKTLALPDNVRTEYDPFALIWARLLKDQSDDPSQSVWYRSYWHLTEGVQLGHVKISLHVQAVTNDDIYMRTIVVQIDSENETVTSKESGTLPNFLNYYLICLIAALSDIYSEIVQKNRLKNNLKASSNLIELIKKNKDAIIIKARSCLMQTLTVYGFYLEK